MAKRRGFYGEKLPKGIYIQPGSEYYSYGFKLPGKPYVRKCVFTNDVGLAKKMRHDEISKAQKVGYGYEKREIRLAVIFKEYIAHWAKANRDGWASDETILGMFLKYFGDIPLSGVTLKTIIDFREWRKVRSMRKGTAEISFATVNRDLSLLRAVINFAVDYFDLDFLSPFIKSKKQLRFPSERNNQRTRYLSLEEKARLFGVLPPDLKRLVFFALNTGMRQGEIMTAQWRDIDWDKRYIKVKTGKGDKYRFVNFSDETRELLKRMSKVSEFIFGHENYAPEQNLWWHYRRTWLTAVARSKIEDFTFHDLRHTYATYMLGKGNSLATLRDLLGHADIRMTSRYAHVTDKQKAEAAASLSTLFQEIDIGLLCHSGVIGWNDEKIETENTVKIQ